MTLAAIPITEVPTHSVRIYMAGNLADAERVCREHCLEVGLCVTVTPTQYIYTGGQESGFVVGLINYGRFPSTPEEIDAQAAALGMRLMMALCQLSFTVESQSGTRWFSRRTQEVVK